MEYLRTSLAEVSLKGSYRLHTAGCWPRLDNRLRDYWWLLVIGWTGRSHRSDYRKYLPGQFIRIRLKQSKTRLFLDIFSSAIINDLFMTFPSRLKVDAKCVYQQWNWITVANYSGTLPADWVQGYLYFEPGAWIWTKGVPKLFALWKTDLEFFL